MEWRWEELTRTKRSRAVSHHLPEWYLEEHIVRKNKKHEHTQAAQFGLAGVRKFNSN